MPEFFKVLAPDKALAALLERLDPHVEQEPAPTHQALGRVIAKDISSPEDLPAFPRSTMDGYSVLSSETFGASEGLPAYLEVVGEVPMGQEPRTRLSTGQAAGAYTGGMLAEGADAVVMVENTQASGESTIEVVRPVAPGENVVQVGEDVRSGDRVLPAGHVIRPQDIGGLLALGITEVPVARRPRVAIVSTGDELVPPGSSPAPGKVRDINTYTISALVQKAGGEAVPVALEEDDYEAQRRAAVAALAMGDILVFSAGSSLSSRDMTADVMGSLGSPGVLVHGISFKPGKPTIVALLDGKPAFGLPGNPVSAAVVFDLLVRPVIYALCGCPSTPELPSVRARLLRDVASQAGREDRVQVRLVRNGGELCAEPVFGKSNLIYTMVRADGSVTVPLDKGGLYAGEEVEVRVY
jgi:molybdopterin molybdotransferase